MSRWAGQLRSCAPPPTIAIAQEGNPQPPCSLALACLEVRVAVADDDPLTGAFGQVFRIGIRAMAKALGAHVSFETVLGLAAHRRPETSATS